MNNSKTLYTQQGSQCRAALSFPVTFPQSLMLWTDVSWSHHHLTDTQGTPNSRLHSCQAPFLECPFFLPTSFMFHVWCHLPQEVSPALPSLSPPRSAKNSCLNSLGGSWPSCGLEFGDSERICSNALTKIKNTRFSNLSMSVCSLSSSP